MDDDDYYDADEDIYEDSDKEPCDGCGLLRRCEHLDGFGRSRVLCKQCLENIFGNQ
jgi:hypothetical protein